MPFSRSQGVWAGHLAQVGRREHVGELGRELRQALDLSRRDPLGEAAGSHSAEGSGGSPRLVIAILALIAAVVVPAVAQVGDNVPDQERKAPGP